MNIIERAKSFVESLVELASRSAWDWRRCPYCGDSLTCKWGSYTRRPWSLEGRKSVRVQRHRCERCHRTYSEQSAWLVRGSWYAREVHRYAIDHWQHVGSSLRRTAEWLRSWLGRQERWYLWRPLDKATVQDRCYLSASTVHRWLDRAGWAAQASVAGQLEGVGSSGMVGTDGLWAKLRGGAKRVVLTLVDSVSGLVWPPVVAEGEETASAWEGLFERAQEAGLLLEQVRGVASDGAKGLKSYLEVGLWWVAQQRCVFHLWRNLSKELAGVVAEAAKGLRGQAAKAASKQVRQELVALMRRVLDAPCVSQAQAALGQLWAHQWGQGLAGCLAEQLEAALVYQGQEGLMRVSPEWLWRDFRLRLSRGRNQGSSDRLERAALLWGIYRNFTKAQWRSERKRRYRHPDHSPLEVAGVSLEGTSYLDALGV